MWIIDVYIDGEYSHQYGPWTWGSREVAEEALKELEKLAPDYYHYELKEATRDTPDPDRRYQ